jgi:Cu2+-exporting ATPase
MMAVAEDIAISISACRHCGGMTTVGLDFCCGGCATAFELVQSLGLEGYYKRRRIDPAQRLTRPEPSAKPRDLSAWVRPADDRHFGLDALVDGLHCGACMWLIEQTLLRQPGVVRARVSLATRRLTMTWKAEDTSADKLVGVVEALGYRLSPCTVSPGRMAQDADGARLLRCLAVAGFAAGNIMLFSVSVWSGGSDEIAPGTRDLFHWVSALIALPAIAYAGRPFFTSALAALRARRTNMDVPISLAVILAPTVSLHETFVSGQHAYFDSAVTLLFFLLVGRYLDHRARRKARLGAEHLLAIGETPASVIEPDGTRRDLPPREIRPGMVVLVAPGSRIPVDGSVLEGMSDLDVSLVNGESAPRAVAAGSSVFAGTLNLTGPLRVLVNKAGEATLLAEIVRLIEASEDRRCRHVRIADRVARYYAPVVHTMALTAFLGWTLIGAMAWQDAMMIAISVLIITCPCALALAVPVVQVVASQRLMRSGILLKNGEALERLSLIDHVILDKTGTLTLGRLTLIESGKSDRLPIAAAIAANSRHPLARALSAACPVAFAAAPRGATGPGFGLARSRRRLAPRLGVVRGNGE